MGKGDKKTDKARKGLWGFIDNIEGDKVVWIIVFLLIMISILAIFSSTSLLKGRKLFAWGNGPGGDRWQEWHTALRIHSVCTITFVLFLAESLIIVPIIY